MSFWTDVRAESRRLRTSSDAAQCIYTKVATSGVNMLSIIKPSFFIGQLSTLAYDYISYVDKFLDVEDRDWGEYLKFVLYIREITKKLSRNITQLESPLNQLIKDVEEIFEGDQLEEDFDDEPEPEEVDEPENIDDALSLEPVEDKNEYKEISTDRDELNKDYENLKEELRVKIRPAEVPDRITLELAKEVAEVFLECVQLLKEIRRLEECPEGDLSSLITILIDIRFGLCREMKNHLMEDIQVEDTFTFKPGLLTWTTHFLENFSEKINQEWST
ncbi:MAG: hypothetical protein ACLFQV_00250 [Vulcanimicrobiota bacterium]